MMEQLNLDLILNTVKDIHNDQKVILERLTKIETDLLITKNGYKPHEVVELLHYVDELKTKENTRNDAIRKAVISWIVPILLTSVSIGIYAQYLAK